MFGFMKRWRPSTLLAWWVAYWVILVFVCLGPAMVAIWRATQAPKPDTSSVSLNFGTGGFSLIVNANGHAIYSATASLLSVALLVAVPPLLLWALWLSQRPRERPTEAGSGR